MLRKEKREMKKIILTAVMLIMMIGCFGCETVGQASVDTVQGE